MRSATAPKLRVVRDDSDDTGVSTVPQLDRLLTQWATWGRGQGHAETTIAARATRVRKLAETGTDPLHADPDDILSYLATVPTKSSKATYYSHLRSWFVWLVRAGHRDDDPTLRTPAPRSPRREPHPVSDAGVQHLLTSRMHRRTRMMILLAVLEGLRVHEVAKIRGDDIDLLGMNLTVVGKGGYCAVLPLHPLIASLARTFPQRGWWFPTHVGNRQGDGPILPRSVSTIVGNAMRRAGVPGSAHCLRHSFCTSLVREGVNIRVIQTLARHASLQSTQIYTQVDDEQRRRAVNSLRAGLLVAA